MTKWVLPIVLALALVFTGVWGYNQYQQNRQYGNYMDNIYQKSFYELVGNVGNVQNRLTKLMVSGDKSQHVRLLSEISSQSNAAQSDLGQLPVSHIALTKTSKYLNQLSDYTYYLNRKVAAGQTISTKEMETLTKLRDSAIRLNTDLVKLNRELNKGGTTWQEISKKGKKGFYDASDDVVTKQFVSIEKTGIDYPSLIYDGPFSEAIKGKENIQGSPITKEQARDIAADFVGRDRVKKINDAGDGKGEFETWGFNIDAKDNPDYPIYVQVTKKGGKVVNMIAQHVVAGKPKLSIEQAMTKATKFLNDRGYPNMAPTYQQHYDGVSIINFAYKENDVIMYPDLIKVKISLEDGKVFGCEARNYLMSHKERNLGEPKLSMEEARKLVNPNLKVSSSKLAVIPTENKKERFCYEFKGEYQGQAFIVYIDANTGEEANILQIIDTKNGTLTM